MRFQETKCSRQIISFCLVFFLCIHLGSAQEILLKHTVASNENLTQIAEHYKVTVAEIEELNPTVTNGIKENDVLIIPTSQNETKSTKNNKYIVQTGDTKYSLSRKFGVSISDLENKNPQIVAMLKVGEELHIDGDFEGSKSVEKATTYIVKSGDTKYGLSKKLGIPIGLLERLNPHIVSTLMVGQTILLSTNTDALQAEIPDEISEKAKVAEDIVPADSHAKEDPSQETTESVDSEIEVQPVEVENNTSPYLSHTVQPGETLYGLSKQAGISMDAFLILNPKLSASVQSGMVVRMPNSNFRGETDAASRNMEHIKSPSIYTDLTKTLISEKQKRVVFFLPFSETEFRENDVNKQEFNDSENANDDFLRGALIAIDSAKTLGLNVDYEIVDAKNAKLTDDLLKLSQESAINSPDAILLPTYQKNIDEFAAVVAENNIPIITTSNLPVNSKSSNLYEAIPSIEVHRHVMLDYLSSIKDANLIVLSDKSRSESRNYVLSKTPSIKFLQVDENGTFSTEELIKMFQKDSKNYVILDTDKNGVFISATNVLLREMSNFKIQLAVLEPSLIPDEDDVSRKRFVILDMLYPSMANTNPSEESRRFSEVYKKEYSSEPETMAIYGFDITFDTLLRLFQSENFETGVKKITKYGTLKIQYSKNESGYYSNFGVNIFQYETNDRQVQVK